MQHFLSQGIQYRVNQSRAKQINLSKMFSFFRISAGQVLYKQMLFGQGK